MESTPLTEIQPVNPVAPYLGGKRNLAKRITMHIATILVRHFIWIRIKLLHWNYDTGDWSAGRLLVYAICVFFLLDTVPKNLSLI